MAGTVILYDPTAPRREDGGSTLADGGAAGIGSWFHQTMPNPISIISSTTLRTCWSAATAWHGDQAQEASGIGAGAGGSATGVHRACDLVITGSGD